MSLTNYKDLSMQKLNNKNFAMYNSIRCNFISLSQNNIQSYIANNFMLKIISKITSMKDVLC